MIVRALMDARPARTPSSAFAFLVPVSVVGFGE